MRKFHLLIIMSLIIGLLAACDNNAESGAEEDDRPQLTVTTTFLYDMVEVLEEGVDGFNTELIIPAGEDPHVYEPTSSDLQMLVESDVILYQGLNFEGRMVDALDTGTAVAENFEEGNLETMEEEDGEEVDPHFWFDLDLYKQAMQIVADTLSEENPEGVAQYQENLDSYFSELDELDQYVTDRINEIPEESRIVITPHDAFGYLASSYDLEVHAPQGFSTDSEVSNNMIQQTAELILENDINAIFVESTTNPDRMQRLQEIVSSQGGEVEVVSGEDNALLSDSLAPEGQSGDTFISMYKHNIDIIVDNLK